jgi:hypothetical protein
MPILDGAGLKHLFRGLSEARLVAIRHRQRGYAWQEERAA